MTAGHVYHWKHGWIPLDHPAATPGDRATGRLGPAALKQFHKNTDSHLAKAVDAHKRDQASQFSNALQDARQAEHDRTKLTHADIAGATHVRDRHGWHEVVKVNTKSTTVKTPHSWTETIPHDKVLEVRQPKSEGQAMLEKVPESKLLSMGQGSYKETKQIVNAELTKRWKAASTERLHSLLMGTSVDQAQKNIIRSILATR